jgi:uncharacterized protein (DUF58 family)
VTDRGRFALSQLGAACWVAAVVAYLLSLLTGDGWLLAVTAVGLILPLVDLVFACRGGSLELRRPTRAVAGEPTPVRVQRHGGSGPEGDLVATLLIPGNPVRTRVHAGCDAAVVSYVAAGRGPLPGVRWIADTYGPLGLAARRRHRLEETPVLAYPPRAEPLTVRLTAAGAGSLGEARSGTGPEPSGVRAFRPGDGPRSVHWRSTARRGIPIVRDTATEQAEGLLVAAGRLLAADEPRLARVAATAAGCVTSGIPVRLVNAAGELQPATVTEALDWFALLESGPSPRDVDGALWVGGAPLWVGGEAVTAGGLR